MSEELNPCPFCGSNDIGYDYIRTYSTDSSYGVFGCRCCGNRFQTAEYNKATAEDVHKWNSRANEQQRQDCEPVAWQARSIKGGDWGPPITSKRIADEIASDGKFEVRPLYAAPPKREPLTSEQIEELFEDGLGFEPKKTIVREIERAHKIGGQS